MHLNSYSIVKPDESQPDKYVISGMLDFGDVHYNYYVFEIAIAVCYMMLECKSMHILDAPGHVLAGYNRLRSIPDGEFVLLKVFVLANYSFFFTVKRNIHGATNI